MLMGMQPETYMRVAGFVEFNLTFVLLGAAFRCGPSGCGGTTSDLSASDLPVRSA
jgi:hypothetical protein